ncbi:hypothetical protein [Isoptericola croceus]|uniref:hypothetical protein n=1 Tax=Isoptericola croceus TaxID=3031406 RepID=UPI0023FA37CC|nr:hypothetical protein [Isoptericola croceus]
MIGAYPDDRGEHSRGLTRRQWAARVVALVAGCLAIADGFRWGNRLYVSTMFDEGSWTALERADAAQEALVSGLGFLTITVLAAVVGWSLWPRRWTPHRGG